MVCPLGLVHSNHPRFLLSHLFSVSCVTFFLGLFPCLAGAWLPIVHKNFGEVDFLRSSLWKNVFISSFHLIWYSKLKIIFPQNFEDIAPMVSNVKDTDFYPLYATCFLSSLEAFRIFSFPSVQRERRHFGRPLHTAPWLLPFQAGWAWAFFFMALCRFGRWQKNC